MPLPGNVIATIVLALVAVVVIVIASVFVAQEFQHAKPRGANVSKVTAALRRVLRGTGAGSGSCSSAPCANAAKLNVGEPGPPVPRPTSVTEPVCDPLQNVPPYELTGTWYGIAASSKPVPVSEFLSNFAVLQRYFAKPNPVLPWSGFLVHLDTPAAVKDGVVTYSNDIGMIAEQIAGLPGNALRVGFELDPAEDSSWQISPETIIVPTTVPGFPSVPYSLPPKLQWFVGGTPSTTGAPNNPNFTFFGGPGSKVLSEPVNPQIVPASAVNVATGFPYQYGIASCWNGFNACPYKPTSSQTGCGSSVYLPPCNGVPLACADTDTACPECVPDGCPGNYGRIAWYICAVNDIIRAIGKARQAAAGPAATLVPPPVITTVAFETESAGSVGVACGLFMLGYGMQQFGTREDCFPTSLPPYPDGTPRTDTKFRVYVNGGPDVGPATITPGTACYDWANVQIADQVQYPGKTYGDMLSFKGSGEYYWLGSESDAGNVGGGGLPGAGLAPSLLAMGYIGCPQSGVTKQYFDDRCGCRSTVYNTYSKVDNGGTALMGILGPLYDQYKTDIPLTAPVFSLEHLGSDANPLNFATCLNSHNFYQFQGTGPDPTGTASCWGCFYDPTTLARCGVFNGFGNWTESCMRQFLEAFVMRFSKPGAATRQEVVLYDMGFLPPSWFAAEDAGYEQPARPYTTAAVVPLCSDTVTTGCVPTTCAQVTEAPCGFSCPSVVPGAIVPFAPPPGSNPQPNCKVKPGNSTCASGIVCTTDAVCIAADPTSYCKGNGTCH